MARKEISLDQIGVLVDRKIRQAVGVNASKLQLERERVLKYADGALPKPQHAGQSSYVSNDVYDSVEAMKADLLETFGGSQDIVKFSPQGPDDVEPCRIATEYVSYIVYRRNPGFFIFHDIIEDGLQARVGVVKAYWNEDKEYEDETFESLAEEEVQGLAADDQIEELEADLQKDGTYKGTLSRIKTDKSGVVIENVAPEEFFVEAQAKCLKGYFHGQRTLLTKSEMQAQGIPIEKLKGLKPDADENHDTDAEKDVRFDKIDTGYSANDDGGNEDDQKYVVYECYSTMTLKKGDRARLYKVIQVQKKVLVCEEVDRSPFIAFVPLRRAHSMWGNNFAARVIPTQNARTVLTRGILDHTSITNNPRYTVLQGGLVNPREMLDNRLGGMVNISRPDAVRPLEQAPLNPFVFNTLEMLKANKEETTGTSSLAQGLNKDAISSQNSQGMVEDLVDLSKQRAKVIARNFSMFLQELYIEVYRLVLENDSKQSVFEVAGNWVDIDPRTWIERKDASVTFHLGKGAADAEAMNFTTLLTMAAQDPDLSRMVGEKGKYNAAVTILKLKNIKNHQDYLTPPDQLPPQGPDPMMMMEMEKLKADLAKANASVEVAQLKLEVERTKAEALIAKHQAELANIQLENMLKLKEDHRKDMQVANEIDVSQRELEIVESSPAVEPAKAIVSPNS